MESPSFISGRSIVSALWKQGLVGHQTILTIGVSNWGKGMGVVGRTPGVGVVNEAILRCGIGAVGIVDDAGVAGSVGPGVEIEVG